MKTPDANHPIAIAAHPGRVRVILAGCVVAESDAALSLAESTYPPVIYIPRADIRAASFAPSDRRTHCPFKGDASYYDLVVGDLRRRDAAWSYETPFPAVAVIAGHVAFYPDRVDAIDTA